MAATTLKQPLKNFMCISSSSQCKVPLHASLHIPTNPRPQPTHLSLPKLPITSTDELIKTSETAAIAKLYAIADTAADRAEMHSNIAQQRNNWNSLLLNSINSITLSASAMAGLASIPTVGPKPRLAFRVSSFLLYGAATALMVAVNKIQPSQLAEEQRNAARLFRELENDVRTGIALRRTVANSDVDRAVERVLAIDAAYPLALLGAMLDKFPERVEPAVWWRRKPKPSVKVGSIEPSVMAGVREVIERKDVADYVRLGEVVLRVNKVLAVFGPVLCGAAAVAAGLIGSPMHGAWNVLVAVVGGSLATVVNAVEHGGQVGMVFEMYRNCGGYYRRLGESIEEKMEVNINNDDRELFELKVGLQLGRRVSELEGLAEAENEFAGKLF
ncbi:putative F-box protein [Acorus calamus]|uniref:F-box protein n=1 Tax=Acorus calamus TaxID=4465 RepID=A0AAV9EMS1_ACOCL|nr:putative F-box protein [Acorus calamus]